MCDSTGGTHGILKLHLINGSACVCVCARLRELPNRRTLVPTTDNHTLTLGLFLKDTDMHTSDWHMLVGEMVSYQHEVAKTSYMSPDKLRKSWLLFFFNCYKSCKQAA